MDTLPEPPTEKEKCSFKLMAVSENKQKLIGLVQYQFHSQQTLFESASRKTLKFQKSIDKNASICMSSELQPIQVYK